jgi:MFS family permease
MANIDQNPVEVEPRIGRFQAALGALAHRNFRIYWFSAFSFVLGWQILRVVFAWVAYDLTGSALYLGLLGGVQTAGTLSVVLLGGVAADRVNRRALLFVTQGSMGLTVFVLLALSQAGMLEAWHLLAASGVIGVSQGIDQPTRTAIIPALIPDRRQLMNALALGSSVWQGTRIFGPALGGILLDQFGATTTFATVAVALVGGTMLLGLLRVPPVADRERGSVIGELVEGLDFIRRRQLFTSLILLTFVDSFFGVAYIYLMPIFAVDVFKIEASGMGVLLGASAAGSLLGTLSAAFFIRGRWPVPLLLGGAIVFGVFIIGFGASSMIWLSLGFLFLSGACNSVSMITNQTLLQAAVPEELRGRVMGVFSLTFGIIPAGGLQAGFMAEVFNAQIAVVVGGVIVVGFGLLLALQLGLRQRIREAATIMTDGESSPTH